MKWNVIVCTYNSIRFSIYFFKILSKCIFDMAQNDLIYRKSTKVDSKMASIWCNAHYKEDRGPHPYQRWVGICHFPSVLHIINSIGETSIICINFQNPQFSKYYPSRTGFLRWATMVDGYLRSILKIYTNHLQDNREYEYG